MTKEIKDQEMIAETLDKVEKLVDFALDVRRLTSFILSKRVSSCKQKEQKKIVMSSSSKGTKAIRYTVW